MEKTKTFQGLLENFGRWGRWTDDYGNYIAEYSRDEVIAFGEELLRAEQAQEMGALIAAHLLYEIREDLSVSEWAALICDYPRMTDDHPERGYHPETEEHNLRLEHDRTFPELMDDLLCTVEIIKEEGGIKNEKRTR